MESVESALSKLETNFENFTQKIEKNLSYMMHSKDIPGTQDTSGFLRFIKTGEHKSLNSAQEPGSFFVPHPVEKTIQDELCDQNPLRNLARVIKVHSEKLDLLLEKNDTFTGWVSESDERNETKLGSIRKQTIPTHTLYAKPKITEQLLEDGGIDVANWVIRQISDAMHAFEYEAFLYGNGDKQPKGFLQYPRVEVGKGTFNKIETIEGELNPEALFYLVSLLESRHLSKAAFLMGRGTLAKIQSMKGNILWQASLSEKRPSTLLGHPVYVIEKMDDLICFGNFYQAYTIVDRSQIQILRDPYSAKPYIELYASKRVGGDLVNGNALKILHLKRS